MILLNEEGSMMRKKGTRTLYRIVARSELSERYASAFEGMKMQTKDGQTILIGEIIDQPHLFGILDRINGLGLKLLSVQVLPEDAHWHAEGGERELKAAYETHNQSANFA
jgi:hypothetical protein